jgi:hypothetical protein
MTFLMGLAYLFAKTVNAKRNTFLSMLSLLLLSAFVYFVSYSANKSLNGTHGAIITEATAYIKSSPDAKSTNLFMLHEGTKIEVTDEIQGWKKIKIANGNVGWVEDGKLELI